MELSKMLRKIYFIVCCIVIHNVCAMEIITYDDSPDKFIREFPLMTLRRAQYRYHQCNDKKARTDINKKIIAKNDQYLSQLFNIAVATLPSDVYLTIAREVYNGDETKSSKFLKISIGDLVKDIWFQEVSGDIEFFRKKLNEKFSEELYARNKSSLEVARSYPFWLDPLNSFIDETITAKKNFEHFDVRKMRNDSNQSLSNHEFSSKDLHLMHKFNEKIAENAEKRGLQLTPPKYGEQSYRYYSSYTLTNFVSAFNERFYDKNGDSTSDMITLKIISTIIISMLSSRFVELYCCESIEDALLENQKRAKLNELIEKSEFSELLSNYMQPIKDASRRPYRDVAKIMGVPLFVAFSAFYQHYKSLTTALLPTLCGWAGSSLINIGSHEFIDTKALLIGSGTCAFLMAGYIIISSLVQMRKMKFAKIPWHNLSALLERTDIVIE